MEDPEQFWAEVLSEEPERIREALASLPPEWRPRIRDHLRRMATEAGWTEGQRRRARAAERAWETSEPKES